MPILIRSTIYECPVELPCLTYVTADPAHHFGLGQCGDAEAAVPVSSAEQQAGITGHHQHLGPDVHPWGKGATQEPVCSKCHADTHAHMHTQVHTHTHISKRKIYYLPQYWFNSRIIGNSLYMAK